MKSWLLLVVLGLCVMVSGATCFQSLGDGATTAGEALKTVAPALPGPWGGIAAVGGTLLTVIGSLFASKMKQNAIQEGGLAAAATLNPLTKILAERKWAWPTIAALVAAGNALNLWHIDAEKLYALMAALALPAAGEFVKDALAKPAAPVSSLGSPHPPAG